MAKDRIKLIVISAKQHILISNNSLVRNMVLIITFYRMSMQGYCDIFKWSFLKQTSQEV